MKHQLQLIFKSQKFVAGFVIFAAILLLITIYPLLVTKNPLEMVGGLFYKPGTYVSVTDAVDTDSYKINKDVVADKLAKAASLDEQQLMRDWLLKYCPTVKPEEVNAAKEAYDIIELWLKYYDKDVKMEGATKAVKNQYVRLYGKIENVLNSQGYVVSQKNAETGELEEVAVLGTQAFVNVKDIPNQVTFLLGTDNFGRDVLTELVAAIKTSLKIGLIAGTVATAIGLTLGLLAGYVGGLVDNIITFITNMFTVIPSFIILILIASSLGQAGRGAMLVAVVIGFTSWPWTCRSVRAQTISLRNRDHVNLSKLSGHSLPRIILTDILPYVASYVVMAYILQIASGILSEAQLSMIGLGPSTNKVATLGLMMNWAMQFQAPLSSAWWAFIPVVLSIALISFSLNLMNTGLDQVFNPQLRD
ncbi:ABC transporter permease [Anaerocolumna sp. MB42-C2]|uniref:ABC transporter permease n=1 Tax=Anaerocolumna sp. MB42-C2 TaxID=3070997 RepID=UPI0027E1DBB4|nr:ABC transporter permease [Anaerocolumna sp. MB42-C2]WMJ87324.1 ABC transporter permease [Anaerocolumna sp. MB42-C2]